MLIIMSLCSLNPSKIDMMTEKRGNNRNKTGIRHTWFSLIFCISWKSLGKEGKVDNTLSYTSFLSIVSNLSGRTVHQLSQAYIGMPKYEIKVWNALFLLNYFILNEYWFLLNYNYFQDLSKGIHEFSLLY
jgi:hypothetical protein